MLGHLEEQILLVVLGLQKHNEKAYGLLIFKKLKDMGVSLVNGSVYNKLPIHNSGYWFTQDGKSVKFY